jgi:oligopeptide transport system substrate-binding protein
MRRLLICLALVSVVACAAQPTPTLTSVPTPTLTNTPRPTLTATLTLEPTLTPTSTVPPTRTSTPEPTATPTGYYEHPSAGFAFIRPSQWTVSQEDATSVNMVSDSDPIAFVGVSISPDEATDFKQFLDSFKQGVSTWMKGIVQQPEGATTFGQDIAAKYVDLTGHNAQQDAIIIRLAYTTLHKKLYVFILMARNETITPYQRTLDRIYGSLEFTDRIYGLDRRQTLVLEGFEPTDPQELDPATGSGSAADYKGLLFSGLVRLTPQLQVVPDLASGWETSPDGAVYTFTLRSDAQFASGQPLTANDVRYSWERATSSDYGDSNGADVYLGDIVGVKEKLAGHAKTIAGLNVVDAQTLVVTLDAPKPYFLAKLTYPLTFVVQEADVKSGDRWMFSPNASGPYQIKTIRKNEAVILERNPTYAPLPQIAYVVFFTQQGGSSLSRFNAGDIDWTYLTADETVSARKTDSPLHSQLFSTPSLCTTYIQLDVTQPPLDDINVRRALALAIDKNALLERLSQNTDLRADTILPPAMPGYTANQPRYDYDPAAAKAALAASSYAKKMPEITLTKRGQGSDPGATVNALIEMWRTTLNLKVKVQLIASRDFEATVKTKHGQLVSGGWCADYPDPENFLDVLFYPGGTYNYTGYNNPAVNALLEQARTEIDPAARVALYQQAEQALLKDVAMIPLMHGVSDVVVSPRVKGFSLAPMGVSLIPLLSLDDKGAQP